MLSQPKGQLRSAIRRMSVMDVESEVEVSLLCDQ
jgi:hypothetical protein